jgi:hypothetical protein
VFRVTVPWIRPTRAAAAVLNSRRRSKVLLGVADKPYLAHHRLQALVDVSAELA